MQLQLQYYQISIHALREEGDVRVRNRVVVDVISIHALREEGDHGRAQVLQKHGISIHALREEGDMPRTTAATPWSYFYPRPP